MAAYGENPNVATTLDESFRDAPPIAELAKKAGMSLSRFKQECKKQLGVAPGEYMRNARLKYADTLLAEGRLNVTEIALEVGFENVSHFVQIFRKRFGVTPKRRQMSARNKNLSANHK